ncbi:hypothetical protein [Terricaulis sp.]|uniref:hypothetical protein n=1 Tax=Terricaulis sp. TaxID=2768686 RepID=UPI00378367C3
MTREELAQDLAYARTLAEEGRHAPLIGGGFLVLFGVLLAVCYAVQWAVLTGRLPLPGELIGLIWVGFGACAMIGSMVLSARVRRLPGGAAISNRVDRNVWQGVAAAILVVVAGTVLRAIVKDDLTAPDAIMASGFGLYGVALYATATAGGHAWLRSFAMLAWALSGLLWFFTGEPWLYLLAAAGAGAVLIVPGLIMMRREPSTTV